MLFDKYKNKQDRFVYENITLRIASIALAGAVCYLAYVIVNRTDTQRTVFLPPTVASHEFWVAGNEVSKTYLDQMAQFISYNLMNITKELAPQNIENVLSLVDPRFYNEVKLSLQEQVSYIVNSGMERIFLLQNTNLKTRGVIKITGVAKDFLGGRMLKSESVFILLGYDIVQGRFMLTQMEILDKMPVDWSK